MNHLASKPVPVRAWGYQYDGELSVSRIWRAKPSEMIRLLVEPTNPTNSELARWRLEHDSTVNRHWLTAQLDLYGIRYSYSSSRDDWLNLLREEALKPDFGESHYSILRLERFKEMKAEWEQQCLEYEESIWTGRHQEEFHALATLEENP